MKHKVMSHHDNFIYLTFALVLLLLGTALAQQFFDARAQHIMQSTTMMTLLVAVWGAESEKFILRRALIFPVSIALTAWGTLLLDDIGGDNFLLALMFVFFSFTIYKTSRQVLFTGRVNTNKILGAICLYLMMGILWAILYSIIQLNYHGAFNNVEALTSWYKLLPEFVYFSFVTLTTLGFGDISPNIPISRFFVYIEAIIGQFYLTILVASLVGSRLTDMHEKRHQNDHMHDEKRK